MDLSKKRNWLLAVSLGVVLLLIVNVFLLFIDQQQTGENLLTNNRADVIQEENNETEDFSFAKTKDKEVEIPQEVMTQADMVDQATKVDATENQVAADSGEREVATLAGGCFWCSEAFFQETPGVVDAISGYAGGSADTADYKAVSGGKTEHREAVQVTFDPVRVSFEEILDVYWAHIDPTDAGGQFADRGTQYMTAIFYNNDKQKMIAEDSKVRLADSGLFDEAIATEILSFTTFFPAEEYHQDYYLKAADHYNRYKKASGREGFVEDTWAKDAALYFLNQANSSEAEAETDENVESESTVWTPKTYSPEEITTMHNQLDPAAYKIVAEDGTEPAFKKRVLESP